MKIIPAGNLKTSVRQIVDGGLRRVVECQLMGNWVGFRIDSRRPGSVVCSGHSAEVEPEQARTIAALMRPDAVRELLDYLLELDHPDQRFRDDLELAVSEYLSL